MAGVRRSKPAVVEHRPRRATTDELCLVHERAYVRAIESFCEAGGGSLDADTVAGAASWEAALRAAGAGLDAAARLRAGEGGSAFLALRPPGHHALADRAMGFCLFNNIAVTAAALMAGGERVAIVDWDVHHGNGTQNTFYDRADLLYVSMHEFPAYPGSGWLDENGLGAGDGTTVNFPFPAGTAGDVYRLAMDRVAVPILEAFAPDWVLVSAGYDAHTADPLAGIRLVADDYAFLGDRVRAVTRPGRLIYFLEGGYDLAAIEESVAATLDGEPEPAGPAPRRSPQSAYRTLELVAAEASRHWEVG
jgi:acetoin utilization deacetylase AcuC-like enzyme